MEKFDIEKIKRNTPYKLPQNTFEEVQKRVLEQTITKQNAPIFQMKWIYAAAAVILLLIGFTFMLNQNDDLKIEDQSFVKMDDSVNQNSVANQLAYKDSTENKIENNRSDETVEKIASVNLTSTSVSHLNNRQPKQSIKNASYVKENRMTSMPIDEKVDDVLNGFTAKEIASLSTNAEQDVYLDLYN